MCEEPGVSKLQILYFAILLAPGSKIIEIDMRFVYSKLEEQLLLNNVSFKLINLT